MNVIDCSKCIHCEVCGNRYANDGCAGECSYFLEYNPSGDLISREAVRSKIWKERVEKDEGCNSEYIRGLKTAIGFIDNAQTIPLPNEQTAWEQGYEAGLAQGKHDRPQDESVDISKLRLMTVEECAGHTIDYAMGWKACIEWIKRGGAE